MNRKDFDFLCRAIKYLPHHTALTETQRDAAAIHLGNTIEANQSNFDKAKFLKLCGVKDVKS